MNDEGVYRTALAVNEAKNKSCYFFKTLQAMLTLMALSF